MDFRTQTSVQAIFQIKDEGSAAFEIFSAPGDQQDANVVWTRHVRGQVMKAAKHERKSAGLQALRKRCPELVDIAAFYQKLNELGSEFGPAFRNVHALWRGTTETLAEIILPDSLRSGAGSYCFHPALLDACFQAAAQAYPGGANAIAEDEVLLPVNIEGVQIWGEFPAAIWSHGSLRGTPDRHALTFTFDLHVYDQQGGALGEITGLQLKRVKREALNQTLAAVAQDWLFEIQWREAPRSSEGRLDDEDPLSHPGSWLVFGDDRAVSESLCTSLTSKGQRCILVRPGPSFVRQGDDQFTINPANRADFDRLFEEAGITAAKPLCGVLHLWSLDCPVFETMTGEDLARSQLLSCGATLHLLQAIVSLKTDSPPSVWLVTRGAQAVLNSSAPVHPAMASLWGLGHVIATEHPELRCTLIDLDEQPTDGDSDLLFGELARGPFSEDALAFRNQSRLVPRLVRLPEAVTSKASPAQISEPVQLESSPTGTLENLRWAVAERAAPNPGEVEIKVQATGLNFRDVLCTLGMYPGKTGALGAECAGVVTRVGAGTEEIEPGDKVMAVAKGGFGTYVTVRADHVSAPPSGVSMAEAASIPVAFLTAIYGLHRLAHLKTDDRVLIHSAAGGVGLAAVQLAQRAGAEIFATAGSPEKRHHLQMLGVTHVFDSRSLDFASEIMTRTDGRGVDIVLNSLADQFIAKSASILAPGGRFLELGKRGILTRERFGEMRPDCEYYAYDLGEEALADSSLLPGLYQELLVAFAKGELRALPLTTFSNQRVVEAFRFMAQARHIGKIVVMQPVVDGAARTSTTSPSLRRDATYLITGGLGGLGLETARWMVREGAGQVVVMGRHPPDPKTAEVLNQLIRSGARIAIEECDVSDERALTACLNRISSSMLPLRGVVHAAGVLDDGILEQQTWSRFAGVMAPKVFGAWNLHRLTLSSELDFFVLFSAAATLIGSPGQGNYTAANAFMDGLAHHRKAKGLPALSIDWGAWAEAGMAASLAKKDGERWVERGLRPIQLDEGMAKLGEMLLSSRAQIVAAPIDWSKMFSRRATGRTSSLFAEVIKPFGNAISGAERTGQAKDDFARRLSAEPAARRFAILKAHIESTASHALGVIGGKSLDPRRPLQELGLDSLMSVELRNTLAASLGRSLSATLLFDYPTVRVAHPLSGKRRFASRFRGPELIRGQRCVRSEGSGRASRNVRKRSRITAAGGTGSNEEITKS